MKLEKKKFGAAQGDVYVWLVTDYFSVFHLWFTD
jgi:hypothetical protein